MAIGLSGGIRVEADVTHYETYTGMDFAPTALISYVVMKAR
jgi:hypothetical protein